MVSQSWEFGIPLCRELAIQYESLYDYQSLSWIRVSSSSSCPCRFSCHSPGNFGLLSEHSEFKKIIIFPVQLHAFTVTPLPLTPFDDFIGPLKRFLSLLAVNSHEYIETAHTQELGLLLQSHIYIYVFALNIFFFLFKEMIY